MAVGLDRCEIYHDERTSLRGDAKMRPGLRGRALRQLTGEARLQIPLPK